MNDPGLESPIQDGAKAVEEDKQDEEDEQTFLNPRFHFLSDTSTPF